MLLVLEGFAIIMSVLFLVCLGTNGWSIRWAWEDFKELSVIITTGIIVVLGIVAGAVMLLGGIIEMTVMF